MTHEPGTVFTLTFRYPPELRRRFARRDFWRTQRLRLLELAGLLAVVVGGSLLLRVWWVASFFAGMVLAYAAVLHAAFRRAAAGPAEEDITVTLTEKGIGISLDGHSSETSWRALTALRRTPEGLVLKARMTVRPVLLPAAVVTPEVEAFVGRCFAESRGAGSS
jgi:hypothetical protein